MEALQIDDSRPACNFRLVAFPNDWRKSNVGAVGAKPSPRAEAYQAFFQDLIDRLRTKHNFTKARKAMSQNWYTFTAGIRGIVYGVSFGLGSRVRTEVYIDIGELAWNKWMFDALYQQREEIEAAFGEQLEWERMDDKRASRIAIYREGSIEDPPQTLEEIKGWSIARLLRFKAVVTPRAAALTKADSQPSLSADSADMP